MAGFPISGFTTLDSTEGFDHATKKIRAAMRERGEMRRRKSQAERSVDRDTDEEEEDENGVEMTKKHR